MPLAPTINKEQFEGLDESLKSAYTDREGVYVLDVDVASHPDVSKLQKALHSERENAKKAQAELKKLMGKQNAEDTDVSEGLAKFKQEQDLKISQIASERDALAKQVRTLSIVERGTRAILGEDGIPTLLLPHLQQVADVDDKGKVFIRGEDGTPILRKGYTSLEDYMTLEQYVSSLKDDKVWSLAFNANGARGSNAQPSTRVAQTKGKGHLEVRNGMNVWVAE